MTTSDTLIAEIKVLLQEELSEVKSAIHNIELQVSELRGATVSRKELTDAVMVEQSKREKLEGRVQAAEMELTSMKTTTRIYFGAIGFVASLVGAGISGLLFSALGG